MRLGADPDSLEQLQSGLSRAAQLAADSRVQIDAMVGRAWWVGEQATAFRSEWRNRHAPTLLAAGDLLARQATQLANEMAEQRRASANDTSSPVRGTPSATSSATSAPIPGAVASAAHGLVDPGGGGRTFPGTRHQRRQDGQALADDLRDAIDDEDGDALADLLDRVANHADDPAYMEALVDDLDTDGTSAVVDQLVTAEDAASLESLAGALSAGGLDDARVADLLEGIAVESPGSTNVLIAAGVTAPAEQWLVADAVRMGGRPVYTTNPLEGKMLARLLDIDADTGTPAEYPLGSALQGKIFAEVLDQPDGFDLVSQEVIEEAGPRGIPLNQGGAEVLRDHLVAEPAALDRLTELQDWGDSTGGEAQSALVAAIADGGADPAAVVDSYAAHALADVHVAGDPGDTANNINVAGERVGQLHRAVEQATQDADFDTTGALVDMAKYGAGSIPVVGEVMAGGQTIVGNATVPTPPDWQAMADADNDNFVFAVDALTAGNPQRAEIVTDLGFEFDESGRVTTSEDVTMHDKLADHPEYAPLVVYAERFADGMQQSEG